MVTLEEVDKLKVNELKAACKELGLEQTGNKADLVARVKAALEEQAAAAAGEGADAAGDADNGADAAAGDSKPAAEAGATEAAGGTDASGAKQGDAGAADAGQQKGRAKIQFNEAEAAKFEAIKVQVVNVPEADKPKTLTEAEKLRQRKDRFKDPDTEALKKRAQRFGLIDADLEKEKALKRAERFGIEHPELEAIKKEQRAARFGIVDEETKKKQRLDKFKPLPAGGGGAKDKPDFNVAIKSDDDFEAKRKARAARFAAA